MSDSAENDILKSSPVIAPSVTSAIEELFAAYGPVTNPTNAQLERIGNAKDALIHACAASYGREETNDDKTLPRSDQPQLRAGEADQRGDDRGGSKL